MTSLSLLAGGTVAEDIVQPRVDGTKIPSVWSQSNLSKIKQSTLSSFDIPVQKKMIKTDYFIIFKLPASVFISG